MDLIVGAFLTFLIVLISAFLGTEAANWEHDKRKEDKQ